MYQLTFRGHRILDVALDAGYQSHEAFTRACAKVARQAPSLVRSRPAWRAWLRAEAPVRAVRHAGAPALRAADVIVADFPTTRLAVMEHRGEPAQLFDTLRRFIAWRRAVGLSPKVSATFNLAYPGGDRFGLGAATDRDVADEQAGVFTAVIPASRCARFRHVGTEEALWRKAAALYSKWLPTNGEAAAEHPLLLQRRSFFPDVPEHEAVTDVILLLRENRRSAGTAGRGTGAGRSQAGLAMGE